MTTMNTPTKPNLPPRLMTLKAAAAIFGVDRKAFAKWLDDPSRGFIVAHDANGIRRVTAESVNTVKATLDARRAK